MRRRGYLVFDIETVPDEALYRSPHVPLGEERPFPPLYAHRPIAIGALWLGPDLRLIRHGIVAASASEPEQLDAFARFVAREAPTLVSWNGRSFDLPVILLRCLRFGIDLGWYYERTDLRYRYSHEGHLDLCDVLAEHGAAGHIRLDAAARIVGLPGKLGIDGSQVEGMYRAGRLDEIRGYCLLDVVQTALVLLRFLLLAGRATRGEALSAIEGVLQALQGDARFSELLEAIDRPTLLLEGLTSATPGGFPQEPPATGISTGERPAAPSPSGSPEAESDPIP